MRQKLELLEDHFQESNQYKDMVESLALEKQELIEKMEQIEDEFKIKLDEEKEEHE